jgi:hypothetical protein
MNLFDFPETNNYQSKSESRYFYTNEGVYRKSNHWGRVANCRWKLIANLKFQNQEVSTGFAKWTDFYPINATEKIFYIRVDFETRCAQLQAKKKDTADHLFTYSEAQKRIKQIHHLFADDKWTKHFDLEIKELRFQVISRLTNSALSLQEIKRNCK